MKHIPILFSTDMILAKMAGRKTQTRRMRDMNFVNENPDDYNFIEMINFSPAIHNANSLARFENKLTGEIIPIKCPYGQPGDVLWTRETWQETTWLHPTDENYGFIYKASENGRTWEKNSEEWKWKPSIFMPKPACRMWDEVVSIRVEKVADINEEDAIAEGVEKDERADNRYWKDYGSPNVLCQHARMSYKTLWQKINGTPNPIQKKVNGKLVTVAYEAYPFDEESARPLKGWTHYKGKPLTVIVNPYVWVIEFKPIEKPENFIS